MNTEQFWQGEFGNDYTARNINLVDNNYRMFKKIFWKPGDDGEYLQCCPRSIIEFGAGSGQNIKALQKIFRGIAYSAVEINKSAFNELKQIDGIISYHENSILEWACEFKYSLVLTKGLLIHIHPEDIQRAYDIIYNTSNENILLCEYYSPERIMIPYRGENDKLWKFDFIKPMLGRGCKILDYGFVSKYDEYPQDDLTWCLLEK